MGNLFRSESKSNTNGVRSGTVTTTEAPIVKVVVIKKIQKDQLLKEETTAMKHMELHVEAFLRKRSTFDSTDPFKNYCELNDLNRYFPPSFFAKLSNMTLSQAENSNYFKDFILKFALSSQAIVVSTDYKFIRVRNLTPHQSTDMVFGKFLCTCGSSWENNFTWKDCWQMCKAHGGGCGKKVYPYQQTVDQQPSTFPFHDEHDEHRCQRCISEKKGCYWTPRQWGLMCEKGAAILAAKIDTCIRTQTNFNTMKPTQNVCQLKVISSDTECIELHRQLLFLHPHCIAKTLVEFIASRSEFVMTSKTALSVKYLTPFQGDDTHRVFGKFHCTHCHNSWNSAASWKNKWQQCRLCNMKIYPHIQHVLENSSDHSSSNPLEEKRPHHRERCQKCLELGGDRICLPSMYYDASRI